MGPREYNVLIPLFDELVTPLEWVEYHKLLDVRRYVVGPLPAEPVDESHTENYLFSAARYNDFEYALNHLDEARRTNDSGDTALIIAAKRGYVEVAKVIIPLEARMKDGSKYTALMWAGSSVDMI